MEITLNDTNILDLDVDVEHHSCMKMVAVDILDTVQKEKYLPIIAKKLRHHGELVIEGVNLFEVALAVVDGNEFDYRKYLDNKFVHQAKDVIKMLNELGLQLISYKHGNFKYVIVARRP